jgi:hypothetical protein
VPLEIILSGGEKKNENIDQIGNLLAREFHPNAQIFN